MDGTWTSHLDRYVDQLQAADLIPPVNGIEVVGRGGSSALRITVLSELTDEQSARIEAVLVSVPHQIRHVPLSEDGSRPGVSYR